MAITRWINDVTVTTTTAADLTGTVLHPGKTLEVRHDSALRDNAAGTQTTRPPRYDHSYITFDPALTEVIVAKARRNDVDAEVSNYVEDSLSAYLDVTPRVLLSGSG